MAEKQPAGPEKEKALSGIWLFHLHSVVKRQPFFQIPPWRNPFEEIALWAVPFFRGVPQNTVSHLHVEAGMAENNLPGRRKRRLCQACGCFISTAR